MEKLLTSDALEEALTLLDARLRINQASPVKLVVCGGSALITQGLVPRTTDDVDVVALVDKRGQLASPVPFPESLRIAIREVALSLGLAEDWLNNQPSADEGGLFQMGLPDGLLGRARKKSYGSHLIAYFIDRIDQIPLKVYAAVNHSDRGSVHVSDLVALQPSHEEMEEAALWCVKLDPSPGFRGLLISMYEQLGYEDVFAGQ